MPLIDMPLDELRLYKGRNPKPDDFDAYWDRALQELDGVDPHTEKVAAPFQTPQAECYDLYFTGVRGARIHAKYLKPKGWEGPRPVLLRFDGYS